MSAFEYNNTLPPVADPSKDPNLGALVDFAGFPKICEAFRGDGEIDQMIFGDAALHVPLGAEMEWIEASQSVEGIRKFVSEHVIFPLRIDPGEDAPPGLSLEEHCDYILENGWAVSPGDVGAIYGWRGHEMEITGERFMVSFLVDEEHLDEDLKPYVKDGMLQLPILYNWDNDDSNGGMGHLPGGNLKMRKTLDAFHHSAVRFDGLIGNSSTRYSVKKVRDEVSGRAQPPVVAPMLYNLAKVENDESVTYEPKYLEMMEKYFGFWTDGSDDPDKLSKDPGSVYKNAVRMPGGEVLYRFVDGNKGPRPEMYNQDVATAEEFKEFIRKTKKREPTPEEVEDVYAGIRSIAANGEDFSKHLTVDGNMFRPDSHHLISAKLNSGLFEHANMLAFAYDRKYKSETDPKLKQELLDKHEYYSEKAVEIAEGVRKYCIDFTKEAGIACDYNFMTGQNKPPKSLSAAIWPLASGLVGSVERGQQMLDKIDELFSTGVGLINTLYEDSDEQWDNRLWPKMQRKAMKAAIQYGRYDLAYKWTSEFVNGVQEDFEETGVVWEKNKVKKEIFRDEAGNKQVTIKLVAGDGGEYPCVPNLRMGIGAVKDMIRTLPYLEKMAKLYAIRKQEKTLKAGQHLGLLLSHNL